VTPDRVNRRHIIHVIRSLTQFVERLAILASPFFYRSDVRGSVKEASGGKPAG
jgi:hypothetical protein